MSRSSFLQRFIQFIEHFKYSISRKNNQYITWKIQIVYATLLFKLIVLGHLNDLKKKHSSEVFNKFKSICDAAAYRIKLSLYYSKISNNSTSYSPNCILIFSKQNKNSYKHPIYTKTLQQAFGDIFAYFTHDKKLFDIFGNTYELSPEQAQPNFLLELIDLQSDDKLKSKLGEGDLLKFYKFLPKTFPNLQHNSIIVQAYSEIRISASKHFYS